MSADEHPSAKPTACEARMENLSDILELEQDLYETYVAPN
jgi:hypothetical protein